MRETGEGGAGAERRGGAAWVTSGVRRLADRQDEGVRALDALGRVENLIFGFACLRACDEVNQNLRVR